MTDTITLTGLVATEPRNIVTSEGLAITNFRLASTQRRYDKSEAKWVDGDTNWYTVTCFRQLAINASGSLSKGERVIVTGRLKLRSWDTGERAGMNVDVEAEALGHDLLWGTTTFSRSMSTAQGLRDGQGAQDSQDARDAQDAQGFPSGAASDNALAGESQGESGVATRPDTFEPVASGHPAPEPAF